GAIAAGCASMLFLAMILQFGPAPQRDDSLAGTLNNLAASAGTIFLRDDKNAIMQFDDCASGNPGPRVMPPDFARPSESDLVAQLSTSLVSKDGHILDMATMSDTDRQRAEQLLEQIKNLRTSPARSAADTIRVNKIGLVASLSVSAKAL